MTLSVIQFSMNESSYVDVIKSNVHWLVSDIFGAKAASGLALLMPYMANGSLLAYLKKERPNLDLTDDAELDAVKCKWVQLYVDVIV